MIPTPFRDYTISELQTCARELVTGLQARAEGFHEDLWRGRRAWTELVLNWFASACPLDVLCDTSAPPDGWSNEWAREANKVGIDVPSRSSRQDSRSEFLQIDQVHSTYPSYAGAYRTPDYWKRALEQGKPLEILLALESEWKGDTDALAFADTLHSASKLASVRARTKVLVFGSRGRADETRLTSPAHVPAEVAQLRKQAGDSSAPWLLVDLPWAAWRGGVAPRAWTVDAGQEHFAEVK